MRILLAIIFVGLLSAPLSAQEFQGTLKEIQATGKIKLGYRQFLPPMSSLSDDENPIGYSVDLCNHVVTGVESKLGKEVAVEYIPVTSDNRFEALTTNKIDILCGATTVTLDRRETVDFTQLTFVTGGAYLALKGRKIRNNFDGKKIGVGKGTTTAVALEELFKDTGTQVEIVLLDSLDEGINALKKGELDILSADQVVLIGLIIKEANPGIFNLLPDMFSYEPFALAVRSNDADFRLVADRVLSNLYRSNEIETIYEKWFGQVTAGMPSALEALYMISAIPEK